MKVKSITLHGFKSFADRTRIDFHEGMTAIVGPNGCGKSNISDALRWVLGEQRPSAIRGSRMEEAIFQGTSQRKPIHRAEVALTLANEDGILPVPYQEVVIGRTVLRGGDSVYTLNESACRLRDIHDLCRDTGLGANAYSIIEGRMVDAILSDRAEERRTLFEEAAEVGRYKDRRRTALRRLDQAEQDLKRLEDVIGEVGSKVRSLSRQRGRARKYGDLRDKRLQLEIAVAEARLDSIEAGLEKAESDLLECRQRLPEQEAQLRRQETEAEALRMKMLERDQERSRLAGRLERVRTRLEELERLRLVSGERVSTAEGRIEGIRAERDSMDERRGAIAAELGELDQAIQAAGDDLAELRGKVETVESLVEGLRQRRQDSEDREREALASLAEVIRETGEAEAGGEARRERTHARRLEVERLREELEEAARLVGKLEEHSREALAEEHSREAELREAEERLEEAREEERRCRDELRERRDALAAREGQATALEARRSGLAGMLAAGRDLPPIVADLVAELGDESGVLGVLADFMTVAAVQAPAVEACLGPLLSGVVVRDWKAVLAVRAWLAKREADGIILLPIDPGPRAVEAPSGGLVDRISVHGAGEKWARTLLAGVDADGEDGFNPREQAWVTTDGSGQDRLGVVRLGQPGAGKGVLRRRAELTEVTERMEELEGARSVLVDEVGRLEAELKTLADKRVNLDATLEVSGRSHRKARAEREASHEALERARRSAQEVDARVAELDGSLAEVDSRAAEDEEKLERLKARRRTAEETLAGERAAAMSASTDWERENEALQELKVRMARQEARLAAIEDRRRRAVEASGELEERASQLDAEYQGLNATIESGREQIAGSEEELVELLDGRRDLDDRLRGLQEGLDDRRRELENLEMLLRAARKTEREESERRHGLELEIAQLRGQRATLRERLEAEWEASFEDLRARVESPEEGNPEDWAQELEEVRIHLARIGPVNLIAASEYEEEKQRLDFLESQKADLERATQDLHDSIRRINDAASASFSRVFSQVRDNFRRIFVTLFEGGECDVWLEDPDDPLDSPIEISASPRGKRTQRIHLLSGGERALTALALLFGIYLAKPSPFCVMDEVDAPLDESNVGRFTAMLAKFKSETQFIVITHNARTIEAADWIYGVTMQEPGVSSLVGVELQDLPPGQVA